MTRSFLLGLLIYATASGSVNAALLKFNISSNVERVDMWAYASPQPQTIDVSFVLDTLRGTQSTLLGSTGCISSFGAGGTAFSNISVRADGQELWTSSGASGGYGGQGLAGSCQSTAYSGYFDITDNANRFYGGDFFLWGGISREDFQTSDDLMADLLLALHGAAPFTISGDWGKLRGQAWFQCSIYDTDNCVSISAVPIPGSAWLLGTALGLLAMMRKRSQD